MGTRLCEICGNRSARYVCQECGRNVCERCLEPHTWLCLDCWKRLDQEVGEPEVEGVLASLPSSMKIFLVGFFLVFVGVVIVMIAALMYGLPDSAGLIVFIGPIPIILGAGEYSFLAVVLAITLVILSIILFVALRRRKEDGFLRQTVQAQKHAH